MLLLAWLTKCTSLRSICHFMASCARLAIVFERLCFLPLLVLADNDVQVRSSGGGVSRQMAGECAVVDNTHLLLMWASIGA